MVLFALVQVASLLVTRLRQAAIPGAGLVRANDQSFTATFNTQGAALGSWDLVVTNSNGLSTTLPKAVLIDFPGGNVQLTDNLFRPLRGGKCKIEVTTFTPGPITVKIRATSGQLICQR